MTELQRSLTDVSVRAIHDGLPVPQSVDLTLRTALSAGEDGAQSFVVIGEGQLPPDTRTQNLRLRLGEIADAKDPVDATRGAAEPLVAAIMLAANTLKHARDAQTVTVDRMQVELPFVVRLADTASDHLQLVPVVLGAGADLKRAETQNMLITFGRSRD